jgi:chitosanase
MCVGQSITAFQTQVSKYGIEDLDSQIHTVVVLGNDNSPEEGNGGKKFEPTADADIQPLSVVAVVCNDKLLYAVWGDVNGGVMTGETSVSLAQMCFPNEGLNANAGHEKHDILYLAFPGEEAVIGSKANWTATNRVDFEKSLAIVGDKLVQKIGTSGSNSRIMRGKL